MSEGFLSLFPYEVRPIQDNIMRGTWKALLEGGDVIIEAGTGSGKTVSALVPSLFYAYLHRKRILYLTRTNSQQRQVFEEFRRITGLGVPVDGGEGDGNDILENILDELNRRETGADTDGPPLNERGPWEGGMESGLCIGLQGRANMCPVTSEDPEFITGTPEELSKMCSERKKNTIDRMSGRSGGGKECRYYSAFLMDDGLNVRSWARGNLPTAEELAERALSSGVCPYEVTKLLLREAVVVVAPYIYFLSTFIRGRLLEWMDCPLEDIILIVDEAHNFAPFARDLSSISLGKGTIRAAVSELEGYGDHELGNGVFIGNFLECIQLAMDRLAEEYLIDDDGLVPPSSLMEELMVLLRCNTTTLDSYASELRHHGQAIQDQKRALGKLPRSYLHSVGHFYLLWRDLEFGRYTPLIVKGRRENEFYLEAAAMDPSPLTGVVAEVHASIHMSGTLDPLEEYRDSVGIPSNASLLVLPPPFPLGNRKVLFHPELSTRYEEMRKDPSIVDKLREELERILSSGCAYNTAVYFPSFDLMNKVLGREELEDGSALSGTLRSSRERFIEERGSSQMDVMDLLDDFRASRGGVLFSVLGGRLSEGMDFPGRTLQVVVLVGIPYPKPNARQRALRAYYDIRFGKGWEYTVHAPASRRMLQALGRMIRGEKERGVGIILDRRAMHFRTAIPDIRECREIPGELAPFLGDNF